MVMIGYFRDQSKSTGNRVSQLLMEYKKKTIHAIRRSDKDANERLDKLVELYCYEPSMASNHLSASPHLSKEFSSSLPDY